MNCDEIHTYLSAYIDKELSSDQARQVDEHVRSCTDCSAEYGELTRLRNTIKSSRIYASAPTHLKKQVSHDLAGAGNTNISRQAVPAKLAYSLPSLLLGAVIGWVTVSYFGAREIGDDLLQSLTSAHIHSLMADHLMDIASSDSHTVKPWFHGRLDFSPPVYDLTQQGYPLLGGRIDYLAGSPAAALVYRRRQHTINLFIRPNTEQILNNRSADYIGYHLVHWDDDGLSYSAISDLNLSDLEHFKELLTDKAAQRAGENRVR